MTLNIQAIHFEMAAQLEEFVQKKVAKLVLHYEEINSVDVTLKVVKAETFHNKEVGILVKVPHDKELYSEKVCDTFEEAVDQNIDALIKQLDRYKEKMRGK